MDYLNISRLVTVLASIVITFGLYHQALKIFQTKSAKDFTWSIIAALFINELAWINYGISLKEWPIILVGGVNVPGIIIIVVGYFKFKHGKKSDWL